MTECEICGKSATKKAVVEDTLLSVCSACAALGKEVKEEIRPPPKLAYPIKELDVDPSFAIIVKSKREALGLGRGQLAAAIKEKESVIERVEKGMRPTTETAKKLEHALKIKLLGYEATEGKMPKAKEYGVTLGDAAEIKVRKKK